MGPLPLGALTRGRSTMATPHPPDRQQRLRSPWGELWYYAALDSTQREMERQQAAGQATRGRVLQAELQTDGHGRRSRAWQSAPGGLYVSLALPAELTPAADAAGWVPLAAALACADALSAQLGLRAQVKWPNDVVHEGFKLAGLLTGHSPAADGPLFILGMGLNWLNAVGELPREGAPPVAAVHDFFPGIELHEREQFLALWLERLTWLNGLLCGGESGGAYQLRKMADERLFLRGEKVLIREADQPDRHGRVLGLADDAALRLETPDGRTERVHNGTLLKDV